MAVDDIVPSSSSRRWFKLSDLMDSMLADVIAVDANFQLTQAEAWGRFGTAVADLGSIPKIDQLDFAVGLGRLENLGLSELSISLPLEVYKPGWLKRIWWSIRRLWGRTDPAREERFRLARSGKKVTIELQIKVRRDEYGHWAASKE